MNKNIQGGISKDGAFAEGQDMQGREIGSNLDLDFEDGIDYERSFLSMIERFRDAAKGVDAEDIELAMRAERAGDEQRLNGVLSRQIRAQDVD